jgi:BMFP domain-containing protein YqiC
MARGPCASSVEKVKPRRRALKPVWRAPIVSDKPRPAVSGDANAMTQSSNQLFDEMARLMGDAASVAQGVRREAETVFRTQMERFVQDMNLVRREEFDVVKEMASKARAENEELKQRIADLEARLGSRAS